MTRKTPTRTCIACGTPADKRALLRVVRSPQGDVAFDAGGRAAGRGAYVCADAACFDKAKAKRLFNGKLRAQLSAGDYARLEEEFRTLCQERSACSRDGE